MVISLLFVFLIGYVAITLEHSLKIDKLVPALFMMVLSWTIVYLALPSIVLWLDPAQGLFQDPKCGQWSIP